MKKIVTLLGLISYGAIFAQAGNVGINTATPTEQLDIGSGNVRIRDVNTNNGDSTTDKLIVADSNGVLKTVTKQPSLLQGGTFTDQVTTTRTATSVNGVNDIVDMMSKTFTIDKTSVVNFSYQLSWNIPSLSGLNEAGLKKVGAYLSFTGLPAGSSLSVTPFAYQSIPLNVTANLGIAGFYIFSSSHTLELMPGTYTVTLRGEFRNPTTTNRSIDFGGANDFLTITAISVN